VHKLLRYLALLSTDPPCPVGRWELTDQEWLLLGVVKSEQVQIMAEEAAKKKPQEAEGDG
jgi:hypothetical protein